MTWVKDDNKSNDLGLHSIDQVLICHHDSRSVSHLCMGSGEWIVTLCARDITKMH